MRTMSTAQLLVGALASWSIEESFLGWAPTSQQICEVTGSCVRSATPNTVPPFTGCTVRAHAHMVLVNISFVGRTDHLASLSVGSVSLTSTATISPEISANDTLRWCGGMISGPGSFTVCGIPVAPSPLQPPPAPPRAPSPLLPPLGPPLPPFPPDSHVVRCGADTAICLGNLQATYERAAEGEVIMLEDGVCKRVASRTHVMMPLALAVPSSCRLASFATAAPSSTLPVHPCSPLTHTHERDARGHSSAMCRWRRRWHYASARDE